MSRRQPSQRQRREAEARRKAEVRRRVLRFTAIGIIVAGVITAAAVLALRSSPSGTGSRAASSDTSATSWDLPRLNGEGRVALADFAGKPTVAVFFASWCTVCEREIPGFAALSDQLADKVNWVGINSQDNGGGMGDARRWGIDARWPLARDVGGPNGSDLSTATFGMRGMPLTVVYDAAGEVVHVLRGGTSAEELLEVLDESFDVV